jgi:hypothetical protein
MSCIDIYAIPLPPTPNYIKTTYNRDVFEETVGTLVYPAQPNYIPELVQQCWRRFQERPIGDYDYEYWISMFGAKVNYEWAYFVKTLDLQFGPDVLKLYDNKETIKDLTTNQEDKLRTDALNQTLDTDLLSEVEDLPDTASGTTKYINKRITDTNTSTGSNTGTVGEDNLATMDKNASIERINSLNVEQINKLNEAYRTMAESFIFLLEPMFLNRW